MYQLCLIWKPIQNTLQSLKVDQACLRCLLCAVCSLREIIMSYDYDLYLGLTSWGDVSCAVFIAVTGRGLGGATLLLWE